MNIYFILCQLIATITFLIMCKLILVAPTSKFFSISLYVYIPFCCLGIAPFSGQLGTPLLLLGAFTILLFFNKAYRLYNLLFFQILWAWSGTNGDTELFKKSRNINSFRACRIANNLY